MTDSNCWATFHGNGGYELQRERAKELLTVGDTYRVIGARIGSYSTTLELEGVSEFFNSVMFDIEGELPAKFSEKRYISGSFQNSQNQ